MAVDKRHAGPVGGTISVPRQGDIPRERGKRPRKNLNAHPSVPKTRSGDQKQALSTGRKEGSLACLVVEGSLLLPEMTPNTSETQLAKASLGCNQNRPVEFPSPDPQRGLGIGRFAAPDHSAGAYEGPPQGPLPRPSCYSPRPRRC